MDAADESLVNHALRLSCARPGRQSGIAHQVPGHYGTGSSSGAADRSSRV
jgi:hypothetical protein